MSNRYTSPMPITTNLAVLMMSNPEPQYRVAAACDIAPSRLSEYVHGRRIIAAHHVLALCNYFKVPATSVTGLVDSSTFSEAG
jgi:hypothetical protein